MTFEHAKVEDCLCYSLSPLCMVFTIMYLKQIVFLEYIVLQLFCSLLFCTFACTFQYIYVQCQIWLLFLDFVLSHYAAQVIQYYPYSVQ